MDLPQTGERLLKNITPYDGSNILAIYSQVPAKGSRTKSDAESCEQTAVDEERQYLTLINIMDGERPSIQLIDQNGDGFYDLTSDNYVSRVQIAKEDIFKSPEKIKLPILVMVEPLNWHACLNNPCVPAGVNCNKMVLR